MGLHRIAMFLFAVGLLSTVRAESQEIFEFYTGVRQLGMGGAYVATVNDETSVLLNPAGLGKLRDLMVTVADPEFSGSFNNTKVATLSTVGQVMDTQGLMDNLKLNPGTHWHAKAQVFPSFVGPNFGFGILAKYSWDAEISEDGTNYRLDYRNDWAAAMGYCFRFFSGVVKLGVTGRLVNRAEVAKDIDPASTGLTLSSLANEGVGAAADAGLIITAPVRLLPTIAATVRDIGHTKYDLREGIFNATVDRPATTEQSVDVAIAFYPIISNHTRLTITGEVHGVTTLGEETDQSRRYHAGMELNVADFFFLRGGMNQRYWTAGMELASESFQLQVASYGEEIGTRPTNKEDRRWVGKFSIRF